MLSHLQLPQQKNQCDPRCFPFGPIQGRAGCPVPAQSQKHIAVRIEAPSCTSVFPVLTKRTCAKFMIPHSVRLAQRRANNSGELLEDQDDHLWTRHVKVSSESEKSLLRSHEPSNEASMGERELQALKLFRTIGPGQIDVHLICPDQHFLQRPLRSANNSAMVWPARRVALVRAYKSQCSSQKQ